MMTSEIFELLVRMALSCSVAVAVVLVLRGAMRRAFGARVAYGFWILVPVAMLANLLPAQKITVIERMVEPSSPPALSMQPVTASSAAGVRVQPVNPNVRPTDVAAARDGKNPDTRAATNSTTVVSALPIVRKADAPRLTKASGADVTPAPKQPLNGGISSEIFNEIYSGFSISSVIPLLVALWIVGAVTSLGGLVLKQRRFLKEHGLKNIKRRFHVAAREDIGPVVIGILKPFIVVPKSFEKKFNKIERNLILAHEREHIRSGDLRLNAFAAIMQCLNWFNPFVHRAMRAFRVDQELACDERVMKRHGQHRRMYGATLLKSQVGMQSAPLGCMWGSAGASPLKQRLALLAQPKMTPARRGAGAALCLMSALAVGTAAWATIPAEYTVVSVQDTPSTPATKIVTKKFTDNDVSTDINALVSDEDMDFGSPFDPGFGVKVSRFAQVRAARAMQEAERELMEAEAEAERRLAEVSDASRFEQEIAKSVLHELQRARAELQRERHEAEYEVALLEREVETGDSRNSGLLDDMSWLSGRSADVKGVALVNAIDDRRDDQARALIEDGANVNYVAHGDGTPLMLATRRGDEDLVKLLIDKGADVDLPSRGDGNALIIAAKRDEKEIARHLIKAGANVNATVAGDGSPLIAAISRNNQDMVKMLLDAGADVNVPAEGDGSPLIAAASRGSLAITKMLVKRGADVNGFVMGDETPLINAAQQGHLEVAEYLIKKGADVNLQVERSAYYRNMKGNKMRSPLGQAERKGHTDMVKLLKKHGARAVPKET